MYDPNYNDSSIHADDYCPTFDEGIEDEQSMMDDGSLDLIAASEMS